MINDMEQRRDGGGDPMASMDLSNLSVEQLHQLQNSLTPKWTKYIPITPTPKQTAALLMDDVKELLYGGAA